VGVLVVAVVSATGTIGREEAGRAVLPMRVTG
jgi:hypothetical protein